MRGSQTGNQLLFGTRKAHQLEASKETNKPAQDSAFVFPGLEALFEKVCRQGFQVELTEMKGYGGAPQIAVLSWDDGMVLEHKGARTVVYSDKHKPLSVFFNTTHTNFVLKKILRHLCYALQSGFVQGLRIPLSEENLANLSTSNSNQTNEQLVAALLILGKYW